MAFSFKSSILPDASRANPKPTGSSPPINPSQHGAFRQLAHHRWSIENNHFKELNALVGSKSAYIQSQSTKHSVLGWQMIGWTLFQAFRLLCEDRLESMVFGQNPTKSWLIERLKARSYQQMANAPTSVV